MSNIVFYSVKEQPFSIHGLMDVNSVGEFRRLPADVAKKTSPEVLGAALDTTGARLRFKTNSTKMVLKAKINAAFMYHVTPLMQRGFDVYLDYPYGSRYLGPTDFYDSKGEFIEKTFSLPKGENEITVNFPLFGRVYELSIGLDEGASLEAHSPYKNDKPIVFYGSSITHGACASRPGKAYESIISRKYNYDFLALGFSGAAKAEDAIVDYMAGLDMAAFVCDYDHNAPNVEYLRATHHKMYKKIREKNPDIPYFMITKPNFNYSESDTARRAVIMQSYVDAWNAGDRNVYFIDGSAFGNGIDISDYTIDTVHPTDDGFRRMADYIGDVIAKVINL